MERNWRLGIPRFTEMGDRTAVCGRLGHTSTENWSVRSLSACHAVWAEMAALPGRFSRQPSTLTVCLEGTGVLGACLSWALWLQLVFLQFKFCEACVTALLSFCWIGCRLECYKMELGFPGFESWAFEVLNFFRLSWNERFLSRKATVMAECSKFHNQLVSRLEKILKT